MCELMYARKQWAWVTAHAESLVTGLGTAYAVRLGASAAYAAQSYAKCLALLDNHTNLFRGQDLPNDLRLVKAECLRALGQARDAIRELECATQDNPTTENLLALARAYRLTGASTNLVSVVHRLEPREDLGVVERLGLAQLVGHHDTELARRLWKATQWGDVPDEFVAPLVAEGFRLQLDDELGEAIQRLQGLARRSVAGTAQIGAEEFAAHVRRLSEQRAEANTLYERGEVPIHIVSERLGYPLALCYHHSLLANELAEDPLRTAPLYIRHGDCPATDACLLDQSAQLCLDVTAVLIAWHVGILCEVEHAFAPLHTAVLVPALDG